MSGKWTPHASLRKFGGQVNDSATATTRQMLNTLKALVEVNGWVITFRDTSKVCARHSGKSSGENSNFVSRKLFLNRQKEMVERLENEQREAER